MPWALCGCLRWAIAAVVSGSLVLETGRLCKLDHLVRVALSVADATCRKKCVDAGDTSQIDHMGRW
jgi:hypothetical protein